MRKRRATTKKVVAACFNNTAEDKEVKKSSCTRVLHKWTYGFTHSPNPI
jgi:hypothetical protein